LIRRSIPNGKLPIPSQSKPSDCHIKGESSSSLKRDPERDRILQGFDASLQEDEGVIRSEETTQWSRQDDAATSPSCDMIVHISLFLLCFYFMLFSS
jgi:hypothetical protein